MDLSRFKMSCLAVCLGEGVIITQKALLPSPAVPLAVQLLFFFFAVLCVTRLSLLQGFASPLLSGCYALNGKSKRRESMLVQHLSGFAFGVLCVIFASIFPLDGISQVLPPPSCA